MRQAPVLTVVLPSYEDEDLRAQLVEMQIDYTETKDGHFKGMSTEQITRRITALREREIEDYLCCVDGQHVPIILQLVGGRVLRGYINFSAENGQISVFATDGEVTRIITSLPKIVKLVIPA